MNYKLLVFFLAFVLPASGADRIDRKAVVERHNITTHATLPQSPAQVGNGQFAIGLDITGLQTFTSFNTMSDWGWHSFPLPEGMSPDDYRTMPMETHGRPVPYQLFNPEQPQLSDWLAGNPHRANLGRIGFVLLKDDGTPAEEQDLEDAVQHIELWTGIVKSVFTLQGHRVEVTTACHPDCDAVGVEVKSDLMKSGRLAVFFDFPYPLAHQFQNYLGGYDEPEKHTSTLAVSQRKAFIHRQMDDLTYDVDIRWRGKATFVRETERSHRMTLTPRTKRFSFACTFIPEGKHPNRLSAQQIQRASRKGWKTFWQSGAAIDLSASEDERWKELERRVVLSQYVMRMNEAGLLPPQESGLVNNGWFGRYHLEMTWWHGMHYLLWNRPELVDGWLSTYQRYLATSIERASKQGYKGARWSKCTGAGIDRDWPHPIHSTLIWQQPHPICFAEAEYQLHPTAETLERWKDVVIQTADFMADYAYYDAATDRYVLGPPLYIMSENTPMHTTVNPTFELGYWRYGLRTAQTWRQRLGLEPDAKWQEVLDKLAPLPVEEGVYVTYEGIPDMWTRYNFEHPGLTGVYGMLPGDGVDVPTFRRTFLKVMDEWRMDQVWGWDFPMMAMAAARLGYPDKAVSLLTDYYKQFDFDVHGLCTGGPFPYFPSNGALLAAVAMMCSGWDDSPADISTPGFPASWHVRAEGFPKRVIPQADNQSSTPCIVNFVNFIRAVEPRDERFTDEYLFQTTAKQLDQLNEYGFHGTFLVQYDALIRPEYHELLKRAVAEGHEVGAWWEITEPHVVDAGMAWRGRFPWDWHANVGFATGYTPEERCRLVDVYMEKFRSIFGSYPASVGSWFIDAHTLGYLHDRYHIVASCNCKDQYGTDGYTLWGGYWNQAYYPSRLNAYMPAQTAEGQIPVPVFRMLGSDPVLQYDHGLESHFQGVVTLEPVYAGAGGGNRQWVEWFLPAMAKSESLAFNYIQAGQENSFGWDAMKDGLTMQMPLIRDMVAGGQFRVETLAESGRWFKEHYPLTPASAVTVPDDFLHDGLSAAWYDSRYYRAGLLWTDSSFVIRDIHLFDEHIESDYLRRAGTTTYCEYITPPLVDGFVWSTPTEHAGLRLVTVNADGTTEPIPVTAHTCCQSGEGSLTVTCTTPYGPFHLLLTDDTLTATYAPSSSIRWALEFSAARDARLPFTHIDARAIRATHNGYDYSVRLQRGTFDADNHNFSRWRIVPAGNTIVISGIIKK